MDKKYIPVYLAGQCRTATDKGGRVLHAVATDYHEVIGYPGPALCGREPGRRSAGWYSLPGPKNADQVTCPKCRKLMEAQND